MALLSWVGATGLVAGGYAVWTYAQGQTFRWDLMRDAALMVGPVAAFLAWRDSRRPK